ncbi:hypothetical protein Dxin01_02736 [Deinococcus xinjiangensis]|uniref:LapA family protein n=1 Tax=Deinococcus xinjiangensis TaxID=457454 RepID=A0ABP9VHZ7_9DEIO
MRIVVLIIFLVLIGLLAALNHTFLTYPHTLDLGFARYDNVPMGLLLLSVMLIPLLVFYFWAGVTKLRAEADSAKLLRDMDALRSSLDSQEASRFAQLQSNLDQRFGELQSQSRALPSSGSSEVAALAGKIDALQRDLNLQLDQMDDYLKRKLG